MKSLRKLIVCAGAAAPLCWVDRVFSQTFTWVGPASGSFSEAGNWSGGTVPTSGANILIDGGAAQNSAVTLDMPAIVRTLNISAGDSFSVANGTRLEFLNAFFPANVNNAGTINIGEASELAGNTIRFAGGGHVNLSPGSILQQINVLDQSDQVISGTGWVNAIGYSLGSNSLLRVAPAPGATGDAATLQVQLSDIFTNLGRITVQPGGTFSLRARELANSGTVEAMSGATISFTRDMLIRGGTLSAAGNGIIVAAATSGGGSITLQDVSIAGEFRSDRLRHVITGQLNNTGTINFMVAGASISLGGATTTISGAGTLRLNGALISGAATSTLVNQNHIRYSNQSGAISVGTLINNGGVLETDGSPLTIAPMNALVNSGTIIATNGGELLISTTPVNIDNRFGRIVARGTNSKIKLDQSTTIFGGTIETDTAGEVVFDAPTGTFNIDNVINTGRVSIQSGTLLAGASGMLINGGTITTGAISLGGTITLAGTGQFDVNGWIQFYNGIINLSNRIGGNGLIDGLDNRASGIVDARGTSLILRSNTKNSGLMRASNGGTLYISTVANTGGRIEAAAGSAVSMSGITNGGTVAALAGGSVTSSAVMNLRNGLTLLGPGLFKAGNNNDIFFNLSNGQSVSMGDNPIFDKGIFTVVGSATANLIGSNRSATVKDFAFNAGAATLNFTDGTLSLQGATTNRMNLNSTTGDFRLMPVGVATLSGAGRIFGAGGSTGGGRLVNLDNTIHLNSGSFGLWSGGWENYGTFSGAAAGAILRVPTGSLAINRGVIGGGASNRLDVIGVASALGVLDNAGGAIAAGTNSTVGLFGVTINGGELDARLGTITGVGSLAHLTGTLADVALKDVTLRGNGLRTGTQQFTLQSYTQFADGATMTVGELSEPGGSVYLDHGTLSGSGTVQMMPAGVFTCAVGTLNGVSIAGVGAASLLFLHVSPNSSVIARPVSGSSGPQVLTITTSSIDHRGLLKVESGATMSFLRMPPATSLEVMGTGSIVVEAGGVLKSECWIQPGQVTNDGTIIMTSQILLGTNVDGNGTIVLSGGGVSFGRMRQHALIINSGGATMSGVNGPNRLKSLVVPSSSRVNLRGGSILDYDGTSPLEEIRTLITSGYNGGLWNGNGIRVFAGTSNGRRAAGYAEATEIGLANGTFLGEPVDDTTVLIRDTFAGDTDLDGTVNIADFSRLAVNFNSPAKWTTGDFNYDGVANISDFSLMASNFNQMLAGDLPALSEVEVPRNAVPEPAMFGAIAAAWAFMRRRRMMRRD